MNPGLRGRVKTECQVRAISTKGPLAWPQLGLPIRPRLLRVVFPLPPSPAVEGPSEDFTEAEAHPVDSIRARHLLDGFMGAKGLRADFMEGEVHLEDSMEEVEAIAEPQRREMRTSVSPN